MARLSYQIHNATLQDKSLHLVLRVLLSFKSVDIDAAVRALDQPRLDTLMKYIYRGFEFPSEGSSAQLLTWHEKVFTQRSFYFALFIVATLQLVCYKVSKYCIYSVMK